MQDVKEEVRSKLAIEDVIGEYVQLARAGRNFKGLSPFNDEKTPSFYVSPEKNIWHDFSSNKGGDVFSFVMEVEGLDFRQALEHLARKAGVDLSLYDNKASRGMAEQKKRLIEANELAARYYQHSLLKSKTALEYVFKKRGLNKQIVQDFKIGYSPSSGDALSKFLVSRGFKSQEISKAGLMSRYGKDMFRGRMMIPLMDSTGRVIGFTARAIKDSDNGPKYINTPQTLVYDKSRHVFGLSQAKEAIRKSDYSVVVEGNLDVVSSHQAGVEPVVATAGTALTEHHLRALSRLSGNIRLAFDADKAGLAATERVIPIAQKVGVELEIISMGGDAKDPDELIKQDPTLWQRAIEEPEPAIDWVIRQYAKREDLSTAAGKRVFSTQGLRLVAELGDGVEREHYLKLIAEKIDTSIDALQLKLKTIGSNEPAKLRSVKSSSESDETTKSIYQDNMLALGLIDSSTHDLFKDVDPEIFDGEDRRDVIRYIAKNSGKTLTDTPTALQKHDTYVKILLLKADTRYAEWNAQDRYFETARLLRQVIKEHKKKQKERLTEELRDAETIGDENKSSELRSQINQLIKEIQGAKS